MCSSDLSFRSGGFKSGERAFPAACHVEGRASAVRADVARPEQRERASACAADGRGRDRIRHKLRAFRQGAFGQQFKTGCEGVRFHRGEHAHPEAHGHDAFRPVAAGFLLHKEQERGAQARLVHQRSVQLTQGSMLFTMIGTSANWQPRIITFRASQFM